MKQRRKVVSLFLISFLFLFSFLPNAIAQKEQEAISSFEKRVAIFGKFLVSNPLLLHKEGSKYSPTRIIFFYSSFRNCKISYDVKKTDSLISPFTGYISVNYMEFNSKNCGDLDTGIDILGKHFSTIEAARSSKDNASCYARGLERTVKFIFAYQNSKWVFKDVLNTYTNKTALWIEPALSGRSNENQFYVEDNEFWKALIE